MSSTFGYFTRQPVAPLNRKRLALILDAVHSRSRELARPLRVVDLACGGGLIAGSVAALGHRTVGLDLRADEVELARQFASEEDLGCLAIWSIRLTDRHLTMRPQDVLSLEYRPHCRPVARPIAPSWDLGRETLMVTPDTDVRQALWRPLDQCKKNGHKLGTKKQGQVPPAGPRRGIQARCLQLRDQVRDTGVEHVLTKHSQPRAKLVPLHRASHPDVVCVDQGTVLVYERPLDPLDDDWTLTAPEPCCS